MMRSKAAKIASSNRGRGKRGEYLVRDLIRSEGFECHRIPASGAAQGFKGDLEVRFNDGSKMAVEVKVRKTQFQAIYEFVKGLGFANLETVIISGEFRAVVRASHQTHPIPLDKKLLTSLMSCRKYIQDCAVIAIKQDRKPVLFLRFL